MRFPRTRTAITLTTADGSLQETPPQALKMMGRDYPSYTPEGGVACYVVEARARDEWIPGYYAPKILYWLDRETFFPLRIEEYDANGVLTYVEERTAQGVNPEVGEAGGMRATSFSPGIFRKTCSAMTFTMPIGRSPGQPRIKRCSSVQTFCGGSGLWRR